MDHMVPAQQTGRLWKSPADFFRPFRTAASQAGENIIPLYDAELPRRDPESEGPNLRELNAALLALTDVFPDVQPEVFREMLSHMDEESRLQVVTEHLLQQKAKWVRGRYRVRSKQPTTESRQPGVVHPRPRPLLQSEEQFRTREYQKSVKQVFYQEFKSLSHSTIKGVIAEQNFSYTSSRPILQQLHARSWRISLANFWSKRSSPAAVPDNHPFVVWRGVAAIKHTGSTELDAELYSLFIAPTAAKQAQDRLRADQAFASAVNEAEAQQAEALFECECCYGSTTFEDIAVCDDGSHVLCLDCVRRSVKEALFGQGWASTADLTKATVRCFSPTANGCRGSLPAELVRRALGDGDAANEEAMWDEFLVRITNDNLTKSGLRLQRCACCAYVEVDEPPPVRLKHPMAVWHHLVVTSPAVFQVSVMLLCALCIIFSVPAVIFAGSSWLLTRTMPSARARMAQSVHRVHKRRRGLKFRCASPTCLQTTCTRCMAPWSDPHTCFESESTSLRTAIEASATAAVKRTCPKCLLSFVKSSGCNKLVCHCGYTMCYICRQEITAKEGYAHFCQHFRPSGGRCGDCERCDLYGDEDEDAAIRKAAKDAERVWRDMEGAKEGDASATKLMIDALVDQAHGESWLDQWLDTVVDALVA